MLDMFTLALDLIACGFLGGVMFVRYMKGEKQWWKP